MIHLRAVEGVCGDIQPLQGFLFPKGCSALLMQQAGQFSVRLDCLSEVVGLQLAAWRKGIWISPACQLTHSS